MSLFEGPPNIMLRFLWKGSKSFLCPGPHESSREANQEGPELQVSAWGTYPDRLPGLVNLVNLCHLLCGLC